MIYKIEVKGPIEEMANETRKEWRKRIDVAIYNAKELHQVSIMGKKVVDVGGTTPCRMYAEKI
jgi:hypothetical protein